MIVPRGDYRQMAERAMQLLSDVSLTRHLVEEGRTECLKYTWKAVREAWLTTYHKLAGGDVEIATATPKKQPEANTSEANVLTR
jgi:glycosyltransferase involved in cell wall biosynthesis